jgi:hypothetical protein
VKKILCASTIVMALSALLIYPATATDSIVSSFAQTAVTTAAGAATPHYVTNTDLKADTAGATAAVSVVYYLGAFSNPRVAGFVVSSQDKVAQCELFPATVGSAARVVACPTKGTPAPNWSLRVRAAQEAQVVDARAYRTSSKPTVAALNTAARVKNLLPVGYVVRVAAATNPITSGPALRFVVTKGSSSVNVCVTATTPPGRPMDYIGSYGLAPC